MDFNKIFILLSYIFLNFSFVGCIENDTCLENNQNPNKLIKIQTEQSVPSSKIYKIKTYSLITCFCSLILYLYFIPSINLNYSITTKDIGNLHTINQNFSLGSLNLNYTQHKNGSQNEEKCFCDKDYLLEKYSKFHRKIFVLGLPKAGTSSLHALFGCMGYKSAHWKVRHDFVGKLIYKAKNDSLPLLYYLKQFDAFAQMDYFYNNYNFLPQIDLFKELDQQYPSSFFILNYRNMTNHYISMKNWGGEKKNIITILNSLNLTNLPPGHGKNIEDFSNWAIAHYYAVENYFKSINALDRLLLLDIESSDSQKRLENFFHCSTLKWKQANKSKYKKILRSK